MDWAVSAVTVSRWVCVQREYVHRCSLLTVFLRQANAQDGAGFNNANFATPRDGERPRCRMYLWNAFTPMKDGA